MQWAPSVGSIAAHGAILVAVLRMGHAPDPTPSSAPTLEVIDVALEPPRPKPADPSSAIINVPSGQGGQASGHAARRSARPIESAEAMSPWGDVTIGEDRGNGDGSGNGTGTGGGTGIGGGTGTGIGFGDGGGVQAIRELPAVPAPFVSKARPAKLIHPTREIEIDEAELFAARVTVDETGDVIGSHMVKSHPGSRGDTASSMIWQFRYSPALDADGAPMRSTFVQTFAVR